MTLTDHHVGVAPRVLHVTQGFSAQPTLSLRLPYYAVEEVPMAEAMLRPSTHDLVWASSATPAEVSALRAWAPRALLLVTVPARADPGLAVELFRRGADQVTADEGVVHAAAALAALGRRLRQHAFGVRPADSQEPASS